MSSNGISDCKVNIPHPLYLNSLLSVYNALLKCSLSVPTVLCKFPSVSTSFNMNVPQSHFFFQKKQKFLKDNGLTFFSHIRIVYLFTI